MWVDGIESPGKCFRSEGAGDFRCPVVVRIAVVQWVVEGGLHQTSELGSKACFVRIYIALSFPPLSPSVLEPYLSIVRKMTRIGICRLKMSCKRMGSVTWNSVACLQHEANQFTCRLCSILSKKILSVVEKCYQIKKSKCLFMNYINWRRFNNRALINKACGLSRWPVAISPLQAGDIRPKPPTLSNIPCKVFREAELSIWFC